MTQQRHILLQRVGAVPTMTELKRRMSYREVTIPGVCWFRGQLDTRQHAWDCYATIHVAQFLRQGFSESIHKYWYCDRDTDRRVSKKTWGSDFLVVWAMATTTDGFKEDKLSVASQESMGLQFLRRRGCIDAAVLVPLLPQGGVLPQAVPTACHHLAVVARAARE